MDCFDPRKYSFVCASTVIDVKITKHLTRTRY